MTTDPAPYALLRHHKRGADGASAGFWTVALRRQGQAYARHFHDLVYGGPDAARQMAMAWRDALLRLQGGSLWAENHAGGLRVHVRLPAGHVA